MKIRESKKKEVIDVMRKLNRLHVAVALLAVASIVSLLGVSLVRGTDPWQKVRIMGVHPVRNTVWYRTPIDADGVLVSSSYPSWGRGLLHLLMDSEGLTGSETITFRVLAPLWNYDETAYLPQIVAEYTVTATNPAMDTTLYVPMNRFYFSATGPVGDKASLSYYLSL